MMCSQLQRSKERMFGIAVQVV